MHNISIIIVTFNSKYFIRACLESVFNQNYKDFEVIVVDNGSMDETTDYIKKYHPQVILVENEKNLGACRAKNQGIEIAKGEWLLTLDCDTILEKDFLYNSVKMIKGLPSNLGILQPKILGADKKTIYSCGIYLSWLRRFYDIGKGQNDNGQFDESEYIFGACCACAFYNRKMLEDVKEDTGYFDERFFFLVEDVDLAWRAKKSAWKGLFYPDAICYHFGNGSSTAKALRQYLCWKNRRLLLSKHKSDIFQIVISNLFYDLPRKFFLFLTNPYVRREFNY